MSAEQGQISIHTDNILPIIKKWLYAEKEIFIRELVANASDAITKLQKLQLNGEVSDTPEPKISVAVDKKNGIVTVSDTGLGMTADEVRKYINQIAFSGVKEFVEKYQGKDEQSQIIGHFGLGFYSAFMVATTVEIESLSYREGAEPVHWSCTGDVHYTMSPGKRKEVGTSIVLHIADDSKEMLEESTIRSLLDRYCAFIRYPIEIDGKVVNDPQPIWTKSPSTLKDEDYKEFFRKLFPTSADPLFWIHLNLDYPFNLRGVLYFPKFNHEFDAAEGQVKLYCNQVFVADNAKELIPEHFTVLKGVIDCPDLPLNVSRSYLQTDPTVRKIAEHVTKKVADKFSGMAKTERSDYEKFWQDIAPFVKYCMMRDNKFAERMQEHVIFKSITGAFTTVDEYLERMQEKTDKKVIYVSDETAQSAYVKMFKDHDLEAVIADSNIDKHFLPFYEMTSAKKYQFQRIDADISKHLVDDEHESKIVDPNDQRTASEKISGLFERFLKLDKLKFKVSPLKAASIPAMLVQSESDRRLKEMAKFMPFGDLSGLQKGEQTLMINSNCPAVKQLMTLAQTPGRDDDVKLIIEQIYDLAHLQQGGFNPEGMQQFIDRSVKLLSRMS
jgi:molecular chaperone HtpG